MARGRLYLLWATLTTYHPPITYCLLLTTVPARGASGPRAGRRGGGGGGAASPCLGHLARAGVTLAGYHP